MRILYVHERFGALGGAEANAVITAGQLGLRGHQIGILHGPRTGKNEAGWEEAFVERFPLDVGSGATAATQEALRAFRPDVVYVHKMADLQVISTLVDSGVPLVRMVHDHDIYCMRSYKYDYFTRKICTRAAGLACIFPCMACVTRNPDSKGFPLKWVSYTEKKREIALNHLFDRMVVVTDYMRQELLRNGFNDDRIEIHPPVPRMGNLDLRSEFSDRNLILYIGQIIRGKGVDVLLESLAKLKSNFECIILGDGNHRAYCERLSERLGLSDSVHFKGFIPQDELKSYYRDCTVVAMSSLWPEPIATVGLEVMRFAIPVIGFDAGGIKDWLKDGENGFLVPWMDRDLFAARIDTLLQDKDKARAMGERGLEIVSQRYDFPSYIGDLETMFARVVESKKA